MDFGIPHKLFGVILGLVFNASWTTESFHYVHTSGGFSLCAVNSPSYSLSVDDILGIPFGVPNQVRCAYRCTTQNTGDLCLAFNLNNTLCEFYNSTTNICFAASTTCVYNQVDCDSQMYECTESKVTDAVVPAQSCSFPFTLDGQLHYQCAASNRSSICVIGCFLTGQVWATCTYDSLRYVAQNMTVGINITSTSTRYSTISLRSVSGWLTIMSRVDASFPYDQTYAAYQLGFGDVISNFWLGLENIFGLTNIAVNGGRHYELRIEMLATAYNKWYSEEYSWFSIESSSSGYVLQVAPNGIGDAGDMLNDEKYPSVGHAFASSGICVDKYGFWWYTVPTYYCSRCQLFGNSDSVTWSSKGHLTIVRMMIRRID